MAKLEQGILGPFRGKVGTVVGYLWRGKHVVRAYRKEINYPNTESQQAEREWFVGMVRFAAAARQALLLGLRERAAREQMTEGNVFVRMNKGCFGRDAACGVSGVAVKDTSDAARFIPTDYERIRIAEGAAAPVLFSAARVDEGGVLSVDFEKNGGMSRAKACDRVYLYVYNIDTREGLLSHSASRRDGRLQMQLPDGWNELNVRMWGFVVDAEGRSSTSQYVVIEEGPSGPVHSSVKKEGVPEGKPPLMLLCDLQRHGLQEADGGVDVAEHDLVDVDEVDAAAVVGD